MKTDVNGCSASKNGTEQFEHCMIMGREAVQYDYRTEDGKLFSCVKKTVELCREARDRWIKSL